MGSLTNKPVRRLRIEMLWQNVKLLDVHSVSQATF